MVTIMFDKNLIQNPSFARIVADITCDGHLQLKAWRGLVSFYSNDPRAIKREEERFSKLFNVKGHIYYDNRPKNGAYKLFFVSKPLAMFLAEMGVPVGNKTNISFTVPEWVIYGKKKIKTAYLRGVYDSEGCIYPTNKEEMNSRWRIGIEMYKNENLRENGFYFMNQIRNMLKEMEIASSPIRFKKGNKRKDGTTSIGVVFDIERNSFRNFYKNVGFDDPVKLAKLKHCVRGRR